MSKKNKDAIIAKEGSLRVESVNHVKNDKGEVVIAIGAPGSLERVKVEYPQLIEQLQNAFDYKDALSLIPEEISSPLERDSLLEAAGYTKKGSLRVEAISDAEKVEAYTSKLRPNEEIDAYGLSRAMGIEPITAEHELNHLVEQGILYKNENWYGLVKPTLPALQPDTEPTMETKEGSIRITAANPIVEGMAKAFWATTWADKMEELGLSSHLSGTEITEVMPTVPPKAYMLAEDLKKKIESTNSINLDSFVPPGFGEDEFTSSDEESLGWYLAMEAMGHGVSWKDDYEDHGLKLPHVEAYDLWDDAEDAIDDEYGVGPRGIDKIESSQTRVIAVQERVEAMRLRVEAQAVPGQEPADEALFNQEDVQLLLEDNNAKIQSLADVEQFLNQVGENKDTAALKYYMETGQIPPEYLQYAQTAARRRMSDPVERALKSARRRVEAQADKSFSFPNLFSSEAKHWITTEVKRRAAEKARTSASPEQTLAFIKQAAKEVADQMSQAVFSEVDAVINNEATQKIYDEISVPEEAVQPQQPAPVAPVAPVNPQQQPIEAPPLVEGASVHMPRALRVAFDQSAQFMEPQIQQGTWVEVDGPAGTEWVDANDVNLDEVRKLIEQIATEQVNLSSTELGQFTENTSAWAVDIVNGYGIRESAPGYLDRTDWQVFDTEQEAEAALKERLGEGDLEEEASAMVG